MPNPKLTPLVQAMEIIAKHTNNPKMPMQQVAILLYVLNQEEAPLAHLEKIAGVAQSAVSRNVEMLGRGRGLERSYGLLESYEDPTYRRRKLVRPTTQGMALKRELAGIM